MRISETVLFPYVTSLHEKLPRLGVVPPPRVCSGTRVDPITNLEEETKLETGLVGKYRFSSLGWVFGVWSGHLAPETKTRREGRGRGGTEEQILGLGVESGKS